MIRLDDIAQFLDRFFDVDFEQEQNGVYLPSDRPIVRFGLALEPWDGIAEWINRRRLDAVFLHRPWNLQPGQLAPDIGVLSYHLAFDQHLTLGYNPRLASGLEMSKLEVLSEKGRTIGMVGDIPPQSLTQYFCHVDEVFGGHEKIRPGVCHEVSRVAVVGAMNDSLVRQAASMRANVYITGQLRQPAQAAVIETGISVVAVGHRRCEEWGLLTLAGILRERWSRLEVVLANNPRQFAKSAPLHDHHQKD